MVPGTELVPGVVTVGVGAVGGWTSGSDFSLQPPAASVADAAIPTTIDLRAARPAFDPDSTADIIPMAYSSRLAGERAKQWLGFRLYGRATQSSCAGRLKRAYAAASFS